jgi:DNA-binding ferritin-like protein
MELKFKQKPTYKVEKETKKEDAQESLCMEVAECVTELMNAATSFHKLHLKVTGQGSFASHSTLKIYEDFHDFSDQLSEEFQGAYGEILTYKEVLPRTLNTKQDGITYLQDLKTMITELQGKLPYSEIINDLDLCKSKINGALYKLKFLS